MSRRPVWNAWILGLGALLVPSLARAERPAPLLERLREHVVTLASPDFQGRRGPGAEKAADYVENAFRGLHLEPLFGSSYTQPIPGQEPGQVRGRNVGARLVGSDPALRDEWVIVSAHLDHLGVKGGVLYPGADDNASGVAMLLELARSVAQGPAPPRRSLMFVSFDLEEIGLFGSRYFAEHSPVPLEKVKLFVTADMIGRSLGGVCEPYVFVVGTEFAPALRPWIDHAAADTSLRVALLGTDMVGTRSDYGPFRNRRIPYLFFTTGESPCYHSPADTAETLDYPKLEAISRVILRVVCDAASSEPAPAWTDQPEYPFSEAVAVRDLLRRLLEHSEQLKIGGPQALLMRTCLRTLDAVVARGKITPAERSGMVRVAQIVLLSVL